jgi:hypothetical protein
MGWRINELQFKFQQGQVTFLLSRVFRPAHTAFYSSGNQRHFLWRVKQLDCEADHWLPTNAAVENEWSYTCTPSYTFTASIRNLLYLLQENAISKTQKFTPATEADALLLILLRCVYIQKISVSNIIWHKCQSYFCSLLRVGNIKVHKYGTTFSGTCFFRSWKKVNLLKGITGWGDSHLGMTTWGYASEDDIKLNYLKIHTLWLLWSETRDLCWCCSCYCCSAARASAVGMNWQQTLALPLHPPPGPHHCGITVTGNYDIQCVSFWFVDLLVYSPNIITVSSSVTELCHVNFVTNWSVTI